jgi:hypothetical protein
VTGFQGDPDLVTIPKACREVLGITPRTGYELARAGTFPGNAAVKVGGSWRVSLPRLRRYLHGEVVAS